MNVARCFPPLTMIVTGFALIICMWKCLVIQVCMCICFALDSCLWCSHISKKCISTWALTLDLRTLTITENPNRNQYWECCTSHFPVALAVPIKFTNESTSFSRSSFLLSNWARSCPVTFSSSFNSLKCFKRKESCSTKTWVINKLELLPSKNHIDFRSPCPDPGHFYFKLELAYGEGGRGRGGGGGGGGRGGAGWAHNLTQIQESFHEQYIILGANFVSTNFEIFLNESLLPCQFLHLSLKVRGLHRIFLHQGEGDKHAEHDRRKLTQPFIAIHYFACVVFFLALVVGNSNHPRCLCSYWKQST